MTKGQADARTALCKIFSVSGSLVRVRDVHPAGISLEAHYKKRGALHRALHTRGSTTVTVTVITTMLVPVVLAITSFSS